MVNKTEDCPRRWLLNLTLLDLQKNCKLIAAVRMSVLSINNKCYEYPDRETEAGTLSKKDFGFLIKR
jgi:hypothetical protein